MDNLNLEKEHMNKDLLKHTVKNILPRSGSYNLNEDEHLSDMKILNNEIELNSAEPIDHESTKKQDNTEFSSLLNRTNGTTLNTTDSKSKLSMLESFDSIKIPKKKTVLGYPLLCCTYVASIYSLFAYGASSLFSIVQLMTYNSPKFFPLYLLLSGYLLMTLMSFLLIVAIQKENLNLILFWIISLSVFILPEIGLNIVLAENSFNWLNTSEGFYTLIALVVRVTINMPCIAIVLAYHVNRTRRNNFLQKMIKPLKRDIMNGKVLKSYNNLDLNPKYPVVDIMPKPDVASPVEHQDISIKSRNLSYPDDIGFNVLQSSPEQSFDSQSTNSSNFKTVQNSFQYRFYPRNNYAILVRPSQNGQFTQRFVNVDDIEFYQRPELKSDTREKKRNLSQDHEKPISHVPEEIYSKNSLKSKHSEPKRSRYALSTQIKPEYASIERSMNFSDETVIPIEFESMERAFGKEKKRKVFNFNNTLPFTAEKDIRKKYENMILNGQKLNLTSQQIYLPPPSSLGGLPYQKKNSLRMHEQFDEDKTTSYLKSPECNCVNIAACDKDKLSEFLHSNDCILFKNSFDKTISQTTMYLSNIELFNQRKNF
ncbi:hypothetical protein BpHYR1_039237 [Brachionus plicatilis]|uniref:Uncharacterized protein n=1 Tax=Brachionus plicatilis TaxID=10195 RepID=A0A3M7QUK5_BRAPC|nr:hypothetical protein BpHYR1_039237 [Brachionus plicatilis]